MVFAVYDWFPVTTQLNPISKHGSITGHFIFTPFGALIQYPTLKWVNYIRLFRQNSHLHIHTHTTKKGGISSGLVGRQATGPFAGCHLFNHNKHAIVRLNNLLEWYLPLPPRFYAPPSTPSSTPLRLKYLAISSNPGTGRGWWPQWKMHFPVKLGID